MLKLSSDSENKYHKAINPAVILIPEKSLFILKRNDPHKIQCMHIKMDYDCLSGIKDRLCENMTNVIFFTGAAQTSLNA